MKEQILEIAKQAEQRGIPFLVVGGNAVILHQVPRFTKDIDLLVERSRNWDLRQLLEGMGYRFYHAIITRLSRDYHATQVFEQFHPPKDSGLASVDVMLVDEGTWDKLNGNSILKNLEESPAQVRVPSALHLIALKLAAATSPHRRPDAIDMSDVIRLVRIQKIDLDDAEVIEIVLRYGGEESLQTLKKARKYDEQVPGR